MSEFEDLNKQIKQQFPELFAINEMAELDGGIVVRNDNDDSKFSHFHWGGVHFNLFEEIPKNVSELKSRIHFKKEQNKLTTKQLKQLLNILHSRPQKKAGRKFDTVHEFTVFEWEVLNNRDVDSLYQSNA